MFDRTAINLIKDIMVIKHETVAVAESVTSGLLQSAFAMAEQASDFYQGGITAYNLGQKCRHLLIEPIHALSCNCVSEKVAKEMAMNVCNLFNSNWGIGITGYAVPVPESGNELFAYYAVSKNGKVVMTSKIIPSKSNFFDVQLFYIEQLLNDLNHYIRK